MGWFTNFCGLKKRLTAVHVSHLKVGQKAAEAMIARLLGAPVDKIYEIETYLSPESTILQTRWRVAEQAGVIRPMGAERRDSLGKYSKLRSKP